MFLLIVSCIFLLSLYNLASTCFLSLSYVIFIICLFLSFSLPFSTFFIYFFYIAVSLIFIWNDSQKAGYIFAENMHIKTGFLSLTMDWYKKFLRPVLVKLYVVSVNKKIVSILILIGTRNTLSNLKKWRQIVNSTKLAPNLKWACTWLRREVLGEATCQLKNSHRLSPLLTVMEIYYRRVILVKTSVCNVIY